MLNFIRNLITKQKFISGALEDLRSEEEKEKDFRFEEIVATADPVIWTEKTEFRRFPIFNQGQSGSCVSKTLAKLLGVMHQVNEGEWINFSSGFIYQQRANKPAGGMAGIDAWEIVRRNGALLEDFFPSQRKTDAQLDAYQVKNYERDIAKVFRVGNYVFLPIRNIDTIASVIQRTNKAVMVWFFFTMREWNRDIPVIQNHTLDLFAPETLRHSVAAVDFGLRNGKKVLKIDDSWSVNSGINGQRIITEDFFKKRNYFAAYPINFVFSEQGTPKPKWVFNRDLVYGTRNDNDVKMLQECLKYEGLFPVNTSSTGNYLEITRRAVLNFQLKHKVASEQELNALQGRRVGIQTRQTLNRLFNS